MRETTLQTPRSVKKEGERCSSAGAEIPLQPMVKTMVRQAVPLQPMEVHGQAVLEELQPMGRTHVGEVHEGLTAVRETPCWSRGRA